MASTSLVTVEEKNIPKLFSKGGADEIILELRNKAAEFVPDLSTGKGRKEIASNAAKFSASKSVIEKHRVELKSDLAKKVKIIDAEGKKIRDVCDELRDEVRSPLTQWEKEEVIRLAKVKLDNEILEAHELAIQENVLIDRERVIAAHEAKLAEAAEQKRIDDEAKQAELDKIAHENKLKADAIAEEQRKHNEQIENERLEAAKREAQAILDKEASIKRASDAIAAKKKAIKDKKDAAKQAIIDKDKAVQDAIDQAALEAKKKENDRLAEVEKQRVAAKKKAANVAHRRKINKEILACFAKNDIDEGVGKKVIELIVKEKTKWLQINY